MAQEQIKGDTGDLGSDGSLTTYVVPGSAVVTPYSVSVTFDGTGAGGAFLPCLTFKTITGAVIARCPAPALAAGGSAEVSWFPHVGSGTTSPDVPAVVGARIEAQTAQTIPNATPTDLVYDTVAFDTAGMVNLGADDRILTVTVAGLYLVQCSTQWIYNGTGGRLNNVTHNAYYAPLGSSVGGDERPAVWASPIGGSGGSPHTSNSVVTTIDASVGDFFASGCGQYSGASLVCNGPANGQINNYLSAILLGAL